MLVTNERTNGRTDGRTDMLDFAHWSIYGAATKNASLEIFGEGAFGAFAENFSLRSINLKISASFRSSNRLYGFVTNTPSHQSQYENGWAEVRYGSFGRVARTLDSKSWDPCSSLDRYKPFFQATLSFIAWLWTCSATSEKRISTRRG